SPVSAAVARQMGSYLLTQTMLARYQLSMASYDRLFPNQDTMPRGGFGNLIALPLQYQARKKGNTVFVDENLDPWPDQWDYLASVPRLSVSTVETIAAEAAQRQQVLGVRSAVPGETDDDQGSPWRRPPSGWREVAQVCGPLPEKVRVIVAQKLFIETEGLPSALLHRIKR